MNIHWIQHVPFEELGCIKNWAVRQGHSIHPLRMFRQDAWPAMETVDCLIVMGGPMNIYEESKYPWLAEEKQFIRRAIEEEKTVIGICLGAQLIADALGSKVYAGQQKEIGWFPVLKTKEAVKSILFREFPSEMMVFHWHGDTFDLPPGCLRIAESSACQNQAFIHEERVVGLQFHLEVTRRGAEALISNCGDEIVDAPFIQKAEDILARVDRFGEANEKMDRLLERFFMLRKDNACRKAMAL